jgi:alkylated DNA repair dioxygenase AlkB
LTAWFGDGGEPYTYSGLTLKPHPWSSDLMDLKSQCDDKGGVRFNSMLANLYRDGKDSVSWHSDDEPELGRNPTIASISLGAERRFDLRHKKTGETIKEILPSGSLVIMSGECQHHWIHQIAKTKKVTDPRINLTFRVITQALQ